MAEWIGKTLSKVEIKSLLGRGGMAEVYLGTHTTLGRPVAIKVMHSHLENRPDLQTRFAREAQVLANLRHPNILQIYDFDLSEGQPYIVMEYINGPSLADQLYAIHKAGGRLSLPEIAQLLVPLASALDYAHAQGVIHRDIKPGNVLLRSNAAEFRPGQPLNPSIEPILGDFGLIRLTDSANQSVSGAISGTPSYMSPEQARGEKADERSDLYSFGVMLYEMLAGRVPFEADTSMAVLIKHLHEPPPPLPNLPIALQFLLEKALAKDPAQRPTSTQALMGEFMDATGLTLNDIQHEKTFSPATSPNAGRPAPTPGSLNERVTLPPSPVSATPTPTPAAPRRIPGLAWAIGILAILLIISLALPSLNPPATIQPSAPQPVTDQPAATEASHSPTGGIDTNGMNAPIPGNQATFGLARFYDVIAYLDEVILSAKGLPQPPAGLQYEAWLVGGESRRSLGVIPLDGQGNAELTFLDDQGRNLLARYDRLEISLEPNPDASPNPSGQVAYSSAIPPLALAHIRHLFVAFSETPNQTGLLVGLVEDTREIDQHARAMLTAHQAGDAAAVKLHAEAISNLLTGAQGQPYGDLDGNGTISDPGDGYGLFLNGDQAGYIEGAISHTQYAMSAPDASPNILAHGQHTIDSIRNAEEWAGELRGLLAQIIADPLGAQANASIRQVAALADRMLHGRDLNGNERIEPLPGEGGVLTALEHAGYLIDMPILQGANQMPPPAPAASEATPEIPGYAP